MPRHPPTSPRCARSASPFRPAPVRRSWLHPTRPVLAAASPSAHGGVRRDRRVGGSCEDDGVLTTVAVSGYRSLRDVVLPLAALTVVTGPNGSGKSNLYRALRLLSSAATGSIVAAVAAEGGLPSIM